MNPMSSFRISALFALWNFLQRRTRAGSFAVFVVGKIAGEARFYMNGRRGAEIGATKFLLCVELIAALFLRCHPERAKCAGPVRVAVEQSATRDLLLVHSLLCSAPYFVLRRCLFCAVILRAAKNLSWCGFCSGALHCHLVFALSSRASEVCRPG
jgi:hypothetical protein